MNYPGFVLRNLLRSKRRTLLTLLSVAIAVFLYVALRTVLTTFDDAVAASDDNRLVTRRSTSLTFFMPLAYAEKMRQIPGVRTVTWANWFGGTYIDNSHFFARMAVDLETFLPVYSEILIPPDQLKNLLSDKSGCVIGRVTAEKYNLRVGDPITLTGDIFPGEYTFNIRGIYASSKPNFDETQMFFHWKRLDEATGSHGRVGFFVMQISHPVLAASVARHIDELFANSPAETKTETEKAFNMAFMSMMGNITALISTIAVAIVLSISMVAANTMAMSIRERTAEIGLLKVLGFPVRIVVRLVLAESLLLSIMGGILGIVIARVTLHGFSSGGALPFFLIHSRTLIEALAISAVIGLGAGIYPSLRAASISAQEALGTIG